MEKMNENIETFYAILGFILIPVFMLYHAVVLTIMWGWFIEPVFMQAPEMTVTAAAGILLVRTLLVYNHLKSTTIAFWINITVPAIILFTGLILHNVWSLTPVVA